MKKTLNTDNPDYDIVVTGNEENIKSKGKMTLVGHVVDSKGKQVNAIKARRETVWSFSQMQYAISHIQSALNKSITKYTRKGTYHPVHPKTNALDEALPMVKAFREVIKSDVFDDEWAQSTQKRYFTFFEKNILPDIQYCRFEEDFSSLDLQELKEKLITMSLGNGNSRKNLAQTESMANTKLQFASKIYSEMREIDGSLPMLTLLCASIKKDYTQREHLKWIPTDKQLMLKALIEETVDDEPRLARAAAAMVSAGLRTAEAAGLTSRYIYDNEEYMIVEVAFQEQDGKLSDDLKTPSAYRKVPIDDWGSKVIRKANERISNDSDTSFAAPITANSLRDKIKGWLNEIGMESVALEWLKKEMAIHPDRDIKGNPSDDVIAYLLRKTRANIWTNIQGLTSEEVNYLLGHERKTKGKDRLDPTKKATFDSIWEKIKREIYDFDSSEMNATPIVNEEIRVKTIGKERFINSDEKIIVGITLENEEPGSAYKISTSGRIIICKETMPSGKKAHRKHAQITELTERRGKSE